MSAFQRRRGDRSHGRYVFDRPELTAATGSSRRSNCGPRRRRRPGTNGALLAFGTQHRGGVALLHEVPSYSTTLTKLRTARIRAARAIARGLAPDHLAELEDAGTTVVIKHWHYIGTGWLTTGDAALALMAADAARQRRPAGLPNAHPA